MSNSAFEQLSNSDFTYLTATDETATLPNSVDVSALASATVDASDKVLIQDVDDSNNLKYVTAQSIANLAMGGGGLQSMQIFTSSGTWNRPVGITKIQVLVVGGGGGGGGCAATAASETAAAGGGGAGGTCIELIDVSAVSSVSVTIGAGGTGGVGNSAGVTGGNTSFGIFCTAIGGSGGFGSSTYPFSILPTLAQGGGASGSGSGGLVNFRGGLGEDGFILNSTSTKGGNGGDSFLGVGGTGSKIGANGSNSVFAYGGGGGGASNRESSAAKNGGNGSPGIVIVWEYA